MLRTFPGLQLFKEAHGSAGLITSGVHVLKAEPVGFSFSGSGEMEEGKRDADLCGLLQDHAGDTTAENHQRDGRDVDQRRLLLLFGAVSGGDMSDLMRH